MRYFIRSILTRVMKKKLLNNYNIVVNSPNSGGIKCINNINCAYSDLPTSKPCPEMDGVLSFKPVTQNSYEASDNLWIEAQKKDYFNQMFYFQKLKFRNNYNPLSRIERNPFNDTKANKEFLEQYKINIHADLSYGFIRKSELKQIAKQIKVPYNTLRSIMPRLETSKLIIKTFTGWNMISMEKAAKLLGIELKQLRVKAETQKELKLKLACNIIKRVKFKRNAKFKKDKITHETNSKMPVILSCKSLAKKLGYKSAMTGSQREQQLEKMHKLEIKRFEPVYDIFWKRSCNELNIIKKAA